MASPVTPARRFFISRIPDANGEIDPTGNLEFIPAKDSDELYEALKESFPQFRTHKERMREAVIEFHLQERDAEQAMTGSFSTDSFAMPNNTWFAAPPMVSQPSQGSFDTTPEYLPSPESSTLNNTFPSTPVSQIEQASAVQSSMSVRGLREMTSVWSVSSTVQPKIRTRRAMTDAEKKEYRRKRVDGACAECRRRRRKCDHESSESDGSTRGIKKARRVLNRSNSKPATAQPLTNSFLEQSSAATTPSLGSFASPQAQGALPHELPSSVLWPASMDSFEFPNILADVENHPEFDFFNEELQQDPIFQFVDFNQGDNQLLFQQPDILPDSGGVILPQEHSPRQSRQGGVLLIQDHSPGLLREGGEPPRQGDICGIPSQSRVLVRQDHSPALPQERGIPPRQDIRDLARHSDVLVRQEDSPGQSRQGGISRPRVEGDQTETSRQEPRSGMIMPLPSSYATVSQALSSNGGIFSSPATRASTRPQNKDVSEAQTPITFATPTHGDWRSLSRSDTDPRVVIGYQPSRLVVLARTDSGESVASSHPARRGADPQIAAFGLTSTGLPSSTEANPSGDWRSLSRSSDFAPGQITRDSTSSTSGVDRADTNGLSVSKGGDVWIARLAGAGWTPPSSPPGAAGFSMGHSVLALITALVLCAGMAHLLAPVLSLGLLSKVMMVCVGLASAHLERCAYRAVENARGGWSHLLSSFGRSLGGGSSHRRRGARTLSPLAMIA